MKDVFIIIGLVSLFLVGSHFHDVGGHNGNDFATNGFVKIDAVKLSHIGWYMMYISFFIIVFSYLRRFYGRQKNIV